nr:cytochrome P450 27C1 [Macaca fascicularis]
MQTSAMALLARILRAGLRPAPERGGLLGGAAPRRPQPAGARLPAGARAEDKGAGRPGAPPAGGRAEGPRSLAAMPGPRTLANLAEFFYRDGFSRIHEIQQKHTQEYGKIFKSHFGPQFVVSIADRDMVAQVLRAEGAAPQRANMESWREYRDLRGRATGLISAEGEQWLKMRSVLRQRILKPKDVAHYLYFLPCREFWKCPGDGALSISVIHLRHKAVYASALHLRTQRHPQSDDVSCGTFGPRVATILYESRLGCLENSIPQLTVEYIEALELMFSMFKTSMYAGAIPRWLRPFIPKPWREFCRSWDGLFKFSQIHVDNKLRDIQYHTDRGRRASGGLLTYLFLSQALTLQEIYANVTEMLLAGVDTTSFTLSWTVYLLARHPEVQQMVYREIVKNLGERHVPTAADVPKVPLVRALLKETLRLFPVLPGNGRVTQEDLVIGGYLIPKGTQLALCHYATSYQDENFPRAKEFRPERWLRKGDLDRVDNFGSIPFGHGVRSCIGRRIAELEIHLVVIQLLQHFEIKTSSQTKAVHARTHGLLTPGGPIHVRFVNRK